MNRRFPDPNEQNWPYGATIIPESPAEVAEAAATAAAEDAPRNTAVIERVRELLEKYPGLKSAQLHDVASRMDPALGDLTLRSFHARYVLPVKRERARAEGRLRPPTRGPRKQRGRRGAAVAHPEDGNGVEPVRARRQRAASAAESAEERRRVRAILLRLARDVAATDSRHDLVELIGGIDDLVTEILTTPGANQA